jgi:glycosyltransferase involved in cell wall biosynthesis
VRILALEPYWGGSHQAFLESWCQRSRHEWSILSASANSWKWRMRHSAISFAAESAARAQAGERWDMIFCSDMLSLAEFLGLAHPSISALPRVIYFHENQLTYPVRQQDERDVHFVLTNMTSALAADAVWFNSEFHRDAFLGGLPGLLRKFPQPHLLDVVDEIASRGSVQYPGVDVPMRSGVRPPGPIRLVWCARWEHDKNPELLLAALETLSEMGLAFRISVIGEQFRETPEAFEQMRLRLTGHIDRWGYQETREEYIQALTEADVAISTADHEFFGIAMAEAAASGAVPLVPDRLAYPEVFRFPDGERPDVFYDGSAEALVARMGELAGEIQSGHHAWCTPKQQAHWRSRFDWDQRAAAMDDAIEAVTRR